MKACRQVQLDVRCHDCGAAPGRPCVSMFGKTKTDFHSRRRDAVRDELADIEEAERLREWRWGIRKLPARDLVNELKRRGYAVVNVRKRTALMAPRGSTLYGDAIVHGHEHPPSGDDG